EHGRASFDLDFFLYAGELEADGDVRAARGLDDDVFNVGGLEALRDGGEAVLAGLKVGKREAAVLVAFSVDDEAGAGILEHEVRVRHDRSGGVANGDDDLAGGADLRVEQWSRSEKVNVYNGGREKGAACAKQHG